MGGKGLGGSDQKDKMVVSDKEFAIEAAELAVVEIQKRWQKVSLGFSSLLSSDSDFFSRS